MRNANLKVNPVLPGDFPTVELLQMFNNGQIRRKGFNTSFNQGANSLKISLPGSSKLFLGVNIYDTSNDPANVYSLLINGDSRIEEVSYFHLSRTIGLAGAQSSPYTGNEFFKVFAPVSGDDSITLKWTANTAGALFLTCYYVNTPIK